MMLASQRYWVRSPPKGFERLSKCWAFPRHYVEEKRPNRRARDLLTKLTTSFGYAPVLQGSFDNIVMEAGFKCSIKAVIS